MNAFILSQILVAIAICLGSIFQTMGAFNNDDKKLRLLMIIGTLFWLCHNFFAASPVAVLMEVLFLSSNFIGYYRFHLKGQNGIN